MYAVLIAGALNPENPDDVYRFSNDLANMYCALKETYKDFTHAGYHKFTLNAANLKPGIYYLSMFSNEYKVDTTKYIITN